MLTVVRDVVFPDYWVEDLPNHFSASRQEYDMYYTEFKGLCPVILKVMLENLDVDESGYES